MRRWAVTKLPLEVRAVLGQLLPLYQEDRERWPLWTYDRTKPAEGGVGVSRSDVKASSDRSPVIPAKLPEALQTSHTWSAADSWATRLQFAPRHVVWSILEGLPRRTNPPGREILLEFSHRSLAVQARIAGAFAATDCPMIPETPKVIRIPDNWKRNAHLDARDRQDLLTALEFAFLWGWHGDSVGVSGVRSGLDHIIEAHHQSAREERDEGWEDPAEASRHILRHLLQRIGLWPALEGGGGLPISDGRLVQLVDEAEYIAERIRTWEPGEGFQLKVWSLSPADGQAERELRKAKMDRGLPPPEEVRHLSLELRFPYLTSDEIAMAADESRTANRTARRLVAGRLRRAPSTVENLLSKARSSLS